MVVEGMPKGAGCHAFEGGKGPVAAFWVHLRVEGQPRALVARRSLLNQQLLFQLRPILALKVDLAGVEQRSPELPPHSHHPIMTVSLAAIYCQVLFFHRRGAIASASPVEATD